MIIVRQYRHVKIIKRFRLAYAPDGLETAEPGSAAVVCAACPHPGLNLPEGWEQSSAL